MSVNNAEAAIEVMVPPGRKRPGKWRDGVIQIHVTRACDKACVHCTQASNLKGAVEFMPPSMFEQAVLSLKGYFGVIGVFGGNPALHPQFEELCRIMREHVPFDQRGLWCNNPITQKKTEAMRATFNPRHSNLNVHQDRVAYERFRDWWPEANPVGLKHDSQHSPVYIKHDDYGIPETYSWSRIAECDINRHWSAMISMFRGELRAWFCEIAGSISMLRQGDPSWPDTGMPVAPGWWQRGMGDFSDQVKQHCRQCGIPLRGQKVDANSGSANVVSSSWQGHLPKQKGGSLVTQLTIGEGGNVVDYL